MKIKKQMDMKDCGLNVVQALHNHFHKKWIDIDEIRKKAKITEKGLNIASLIDLGKEYGVELEGFNAPFDAIEKNKNENMVAIVKNENYMHFIIFSFDGKAFHISDSAKGNYSLTPKEFKEIYSGMVLTIKEGIYKEERINLKNPLSILFKDVDVLVWAFIAILVSVILTFISTFYSKIIFDHVIPGSQNKLLFIITFGFIFLAIVRTITSLFRKYLIQKINLNVEWQIFEEYLTKYKNCSLVELEKNSKNDHIRRLGLIPSVSLFISTGLFVVFNEIISLLISSVILFKISSFLFVITLGFSVMFCLVTLIFNFALKDNYKKVVDDQIISFQNQVEFINSAKEIKEMKVGSFLENNTRDSYIKFKTREFSIWKTVNVQGLIIETINLVAPIVLTFISVKLIIRNDLSIGSMMMFIGTFSFFVSPTIQLCDFLLKYNQNSENLKKVEYVINLKEEENNKDGLGIVNINELELKNVSFMFDKPLINVKNLKINQSIHLSGKNGSGKSTFLDLISLKHKFSGELLINNIEKDFYSIDKLRENIFLTRPLTFLPSVSVYEFITLLNKDAMTRFEEMNQRFNLINFLKNASLSIDTKIINNGENLSSGQRQIIQLMRLFSFEYKLIILDEALENIDDEKVKQLSEWLNEIYDCIFIEVSHSNKYISNGKEVDFEEINFNPL